MVANAKWIKDCFNFYIKQISFFRIVVGAPKSGFDGKVYKCSITNVANNIGLCEPVEIQTSAF